MIEGFRQGLRERGYVEGQKLAIEYCFSGDRNDRLPALAAGLVAMKVQLILASGTPASFAAKEATSTIPIVMGGIAADPVATGLIASLARPGGNITGMTMMSPQLAGKRLELLKTTVPRLARVAVFWNPPNPAYGPILRGGLLSYAINAAELAHRSADYVDKILRGAKPGDLPIEELRVFELGLHRKAAREPGIRFPQSMLVRADRVIE